jgi:formate hydrogenlyase transcriptional activator
LASQGSHVKAASWLLENGPRELELLFRAIVYHPSVPILIADNERNHREASSGAGKLLGLSRDMIIGRRLDDFADPNFKPKISDLWRSFLGQGEQEGTLRLTGPDGTVWEVEYTAKGNVLPVRHLLVLRDKNTPGTDADQIPSWVQDYALFLLDVNGRIVSWYSGAERIYGYSADQAAWKHVSLLYPAEENPLVGPQQELNRSAAEGHFGHEGWHARKDGSRFWANAITVPLRDRNGELHGFARIVRDFSERHERDEKLRRTRSHARPIGIDYCGHRFLGI